jgi:hypothetical protein
MNLHTTPQLRNGSGDDEADGETLRPSVADRLQLDAMERDLSTAEADNRELRLRLARVEVRLSRLESTVFAADGGEVQP